MNVNTKKLAVQYSILQSAYWALFCTVFAFATVFLLSKGFNSSQIGIIIAIGNILGVIVQPLIASAADRSKRLTPQHLAAILASAALLLMVGLYFTPNIFLAIAALFLLTDTLLQTMQPLINSISVYYGNQGIPVNFAMARGFGSVGYGAASWLLGLLIEKYQTGIIPAAGILLLLLILLMLFTLPRLQKMSDSGSETAVKKDSGTDGGFLSFVVKYKYFMLTLAGVTFTFTFHNMTNSYMIQIVQSLGGTSANMGTALSIAAVIELPAMLFSSVLIKRFKSSTLLKAATLIFAFKAAGYMLAGNIISLYFVQILQMGSYALFIPSSVYFANEVMEACDKFKGQAFMTGSCTLGGVVGSLLGGFLLDYANVQAMLKIEFAIAVTGCLLVWIFSGKNFRPSKTAH